MTAPPPMMSVLVMNRLLMKNRYRNTCQHPDFRFQNLNLNRQNVVDVSEMEISCAKRKNILGKVQSRRASMQEYG